MFKLIKFWKKTIVSRIYHPFYYLKMALELYVLKLTRKYLPYRGLNVPLMSEHSRYRSLFKDSTPNLEALIKPYAREFNWFIGKIYNGAFGSVDIEIYYSMIRKYKPRLIIEVGSGFSTHFAMDALKKNRKGRFISIDPQPTRSLPKEVEHLRTKVEDVNLKIFERLNKNDILFFDSSHTTREAQYHLEKILPRLRRGVIIHHHDFMYPYAIYHLDNKKMFGEADVLLSFYGRFRKVYKVIICASYMRDKYPELITKLIKSYHWYPTRLPASLWVRKMI